MDYKDYYKTLNVKKDVDAATLKKTYRRLARKYHPDVSKEANAEEKFKEVKEAYEVLKDPEKRKAYDSMGANWKQGQGFERPPGWEFQQQQQQRHAQNANFDGSDFSDFFENLFGQRRQAQPRATRGQDQHTKITVSLQEAFNGGTRQIGLKQPEMMANGQVRHIQRTLNIKIPKGVTQGQQIRLKGQGSDGTGGGPKGNLYLEIHITTQKPYTIDGKNVLLTLPITPWEAVLGAKVSVPTMAGTVEMNIPAGSASGKKMRLKGRGLPGKIPGDQYITLQIVMPEIKTDDDKQLFETMKAQIDFDPRSTLS
jgi:curved DNA-binding protein